MAMAPRSNKIIRFNKGINQELSALELGASELYDVQNYELTDGNYSGLTLVDGYERYNGTALASSTDVVKDDDGIVTDDTARVAARDAIDSPNAEDLPILAIFEYNDEVRCIKANAAGQHYMYKATAGGWGTGVAITGATTTTQVYKYYKARIAELDTNAEVMFFCNGVSKPFYLDSAGTLTYIDAGGFLPSDTTYSGTNSYPTIPIVWNQRLILAYPDGHIFFSQPGDDPALITPTNPWDPSVSSSGEIYVEDEITNLIIAPSSCIIFCENMIKAMKLSNIDPATGVDFTVDTYSDASGAKWNTAQMILGNVLYCDDRGVSLLGATAAYGDFHATVIARNIQAYYDFIKDDIIAAVVNREKNQYKVFNSTGQGFTMTFKDDSSLKGATKFDYKKSITSLYESSWIGGTHGLVYKVWSGAESFDCEVIPAFISTSYFTYNSPVNYKTFRRLLFEMYAQKGTEISVRPSYDYRAPSTPTASLEEIDTSNFSNAVPWGTEDWNNFYWGGAVEQREFVYISGIGTNMSIQINTNDKYHAPHTFHNVIVTYTQRAMDF